MASFTMKEIQGILRSLIFGENKQAYWTGYYRYYKGDKYFEYVSITTDKNQSNQNLEELKRNHEETLESKKFLDDQFPLLEEMATQINNIHANMVMEHDDIENVNMHFLYYFSELKRDYILLKDYEEEKREYLNFYIYSETPINFSRPYPEEIEPTDDW